MKPSFFGLLRTGASFCEDGRYEDRESVVASLQCMSFGSALGIQGGIIAVVGNDGDSCWYCGRLINAKMNQTLRRVPSSAVLPGCEY